MWVPIPLSLERGCGFCSKSKKAASAHIPETPSTALWWTLTMTPASPPSIPSTNHISHNGRSIASGKEATFDAEAARSARPEPRGSTT